MRGFLLPFYSLFDTFMVILRSLNKREVLTSACVKKVGKPLYSRLRT